MPRVPGGQYDTAPAAQFRGVPGPRPSTSGVGEGLQDLGAGITQLGHVLDRERLEADRTAVQAASNTRDQWANGRLYDPDNGALTVRGKSAIGSTNAVLDEYDKQNAETAKNLRGDRQIAAFNETTAEHRQQLSQILSRHELSERNSYEDDTAIARVNTAAETGALNYNDPAIQARSRADIMTTVQGQAERKGWDNAQRDDVTHRAIAGMHQGVLERMLADGRTGLASKYLKANKAELTSDDQLRFASAIDAKNREARNEIEATTRQRYADLSASYQAGLPVPKGQELSAGQLEFVFPGKGAGMYASLESDKRMGYALRDMNKMSPQQIAETVERYTPTQGGEGAKDALLRQGEIARAAEATVKARQQNPAQFAIDNGLGYKPLPADADGVRNELRNREAVQAQTSAQVGVRVPLLAPDEAKGMGQQLAAATDAKAIETFGFLRAGLSDSGYKQVMQQISPDSPVKAFAGQIYGRPRPVMLGGGVWTDAEARSQGVIAQTIVTGENIVNKTRTQLGADGKPVKSLLTPDKTRFDAAFADEVGTAFRDNPQALELAQQVAYAYYTGRSAQQGRVNKEGEDVNDNLMKETLRSTLGTVVNFHSYGDVLTPLGVDEDQFEAGLRSRYVAEMVVRGFTRQQALAAYPSLGAENVGGRYMMTKGREPFAIRGQPVVIDLNSPEPVDNTPPVEDQYVPQ